MSYIGLLDCNNFFVSCERLFRPDLVKKPVAVLSSNDGCIVARSQEVKAMGVPMGVPLFQAKQLADMRRVTLFSSNFTLYRDISTRVMRALANAVGDTEIYSIDEAFFTVPEHTTEAELYDLRTQIMRLTGIPVSIGVGESKTIAKVASELGKKGDGVVLVPADQRQARIGDYPCQDVWNIGGATARTLKEYHIRTITDLVGADRSFLARRLGVAGARLFDELSGIAVYPVSDSSRSLRQSVTSSRSFAESTASVSAIESAVTYHLEQVGAKLREQDLCAGRILVELAPSRHGDFSLQARRFAVDLRPPTQSTQALVRAVLPAVRQQFVPNVPYKKAGITASLLTVPACVQGDLFQPETSAGESDPFQRLDAVTDQLNRKFGQGTIHSGVIAASGSRASARLRSPSYTTRWQDIPSVL